VQTVRSVFAVCLRLPLGPCTTGSVCCGVRMCRLQCQWQWHRSRALAAPTPPSLRRCVCVARVVCRADGCTPQLTPPPPRQHYMASLHVVMRSRGVARLGSCAGAHAPSMRRGRCAAMAVAWLPRHAHAPIMCASARTHRVCICVSCCASVVLRCCEVITPYRALGGDCTDVVRSTNP
jgi:hypothetical protein